VKSASRRVADAKSRHDEAAVRDAQAALATSKARAAEAVAAAERAGSGGPGDTPKYRSSSSSVGTLFDAYG
jgi:hypothetical protein